MKRYHWGIIGTGHIASQFVKGLQVLPQAELYAVASRSEEKSATFAKLYGFSKSYDSYQKLLADPMVDVVYIATPNHLHYSLTIDALNAKKAVICEKPLGMKPSEVSAMIEASHRNNCFLMEAMWSAFLPSIKMAKKMVCNNEIGDIKLLKADFGIHPPYQEHSRLFDPALGGGSIYDIGIYTLFLSLYILGKPISVYSSSTNAPTGVDMTTAILMKHANESISLLSSTFGCNLKSEAIIAGDKGSIRLDRMFHMPTSLYLQKEGEEDESLIPLEYVGNGYNYEAEEVMNCMENGLIESSVFPHQFSQDLADLIARVVDLSNK